MLLNDQAHAYAHVSEALDELNALLNVMYDIMPEENIAITTKMGEHLSAAMEILE